MRRAWIWLALLAAALAGCGHFIAGANSRPAAQAERVLLAPGHTAGQSFFSTHDGLAGIEVFLAPVKTGMPPDHAGEIVLRLRESAGSPVDLAVSELPAGAISAPGLYRFSFSPLRESAQRGFYFELAPRGAITLALGSTAGDAYLDGSLYRDGAPAGAQAVFRAVHDPWLMAVGLLGEAAGWCGWLGAAALWFLLPGLALILLAWPAHWQAGGLEKAGLAIGLSLSVYPLLAMGLRIAGARAEPWLAWGMPVLSAAIILWRGRAWELKPAWSRTRAWRRSDRVWPDLALIGLALLLFAARLYAVRSLAAPMWGDSYHHALITQLIVENGGLFDSWQPYAEISTLTYHFGFHIAAAVMSWSTGLGAAEAVLWAGQIINGLAVLALYPLAVKLTGSRWAGVGAVLLAGLWLSMPMFYANWGRYSQLAGQAILPAAMWLAWQLAAGALPARKTAGALQGGLPSLAARLRSSPWMPGGILLASTAAAGLALTHYRVAILLAGWYAVLAVLAGLSLLRRPAVRRSAVRRVAPLVMAGAVALIAAAPWLAHTFSGRIPLGVLRQLSTPADAVPEWVQGYNAAGDLAGYLPPAVWGLLPACLIWGWWRRNTGFVALAAWSALAAAAANPAWFGLPGTGALNNFAVLIAAYIPASITVGGGVGWTVEGLQARLPARLVPPLVAAAMLALGAAGAAGRIRDIQPERHQLFTHADARAADWIRAHVPPGARFLVNAFFAYGGEVIVGSDGGWWLPLAAGRQTTLPPIRYGNEAEPRPGYVDWVNRLASEIEAKGAVHDDVLALLRERGVTHVYIGQRRGSVNYAGPGPIDPEQLLADRRFRLIYRQDRVWIFEVLP